MNLVQSLIRDEIEALQLLLAGEISAALQAEVEILRALLDQLGHECSPPETLSLMQAAAR